MFPECGLSTVHLPQNRDEIRQFLTPIPDPAQRQVPCMDTAEDVPEVSRVRLDRKMTHFEIPVKMIRTGKIVYVLGVLFRSKRERPKPDVPVD